MNNSSNQMPAALKPLPRLVLHADCTTCGKLDSEQDEPRMVVDIALDHTDATGHVVVLNGTTDFAGDEHAFAPPLQPSIEEVLADPAASSWLTTALLAALSRDPVDAANDAEVLARSWTITARPFFGRARIEVSRRVLIAIFKQNQLRILSRIWL